MIEVSELRKRFSGSADTEKKDQSEAPRKEAVGGISLNCTPGRIFSLLGPNGAGKTTALRIIASILYPTSGKVSVAGYDVKEEPLAVKQRIGFLTGTTGIYERITPDEFLRYLGKLYDLDRQTFEQRRDHLYETLGMGDFASKQIGKLSSGMRQKVSIARTFIHHPEVLIFDEPTTGIDVITAENIIRLVQESKKDGKTVLFSTHNMSEVDLLCDDLGIIHQGKLLYNGTMDQFREQMKTRSITQEFIDVIHQAEA